MTASVDPDRLDDLLAAQRSRLLDETGGEVHDGISQPDDAVRRFALAAETVDGRRAVSEDADLVVTIQSVVKPFVYAAALTDDAAATRDRIGVEPTGEPFDALVVEATTGRPPNPMVNAGALLAATLVGGDDADERVRRVVDVCSAAAGRDLAVDERSAEAEIREAHRNRALGHLMRDGGSLTGDVDEAVEVLARCCSVQVTAGDLATMAATLADWGRRPGSDEQVLAPEVVSDLLSVVATCGMYDGAGRWVHRVGMPAKSGISGTILAVSPGVLGVASISPPLDDHGNSVRGVLALEAVSDELGLHRYAPPRR